MNIKKRNNGVLLALALVFLCPGLAAYELFKHPHWLGNTSINKGSLLTPPVALNLANPKAQWRLILWTPRDCETACQQQINKLARIRLALGRHFYEVDELLLLNNQAPALSKEILKSYEEQGIHVLRLSEDERAKYRVLNNTSQIFIANPDNYLILKYALKANPADLFHDLKQLLRSGKSE